MAILIVEDESTIADTISIALENENFTSQWVTTGTSALQEVNENTELIILDVGLPDISGFEVLKQLRATGNETPVIFLTARSEEIDRVVGLEIGADDYVTKPFSPRELIARIRAILRRSNNSEGPVKTCSRTDSLKQSKTTTFLVDDDQATISYKSTKLSLTKTEYLLLKGMISQPGRVFSRAQLMDMVWDTPHPSDERTIDSHIKSVRSKLRDICSQEDPINTHRGLGYSLTTSRVQNKSTGRNDKL